MGVCLCTWGIARVMVWEMGGGGGKGDYTNLYTVNCANYYVFKL